MKYMMTGLMTPLMRLTLGLSLVMLAGFWMATALLFFARMDLTPASVVAYYRGSPIDFSMPRTYGSMIEVTHAHLAMMALVLLLLTHLCIFLPWSTRRRLVLILTTFGAALVGEAAGWLVRFVSPGFAVLKVVSFVTLEGSLLVLLIGLGSFVLRGHPGPPSAGFASFGGPALRARDGTGTGAIEPGLTDTGHGKAPRRKR